MSETFGDWESYSFSFEAKITDPVCFRENTGNLKKSLNCISYFLVISYIKHRDIKLHKYNKNGKIITESPINSTRNNTAGEYDMTLSSVLEENIQYIESHLPVKDSFDLITRQLYLGKTKARSEERRVGKECM